MSHKQTNTEMLKWIIAQKKVKLEKLRTVLGLSEKTFEKKMNPDNNLDFKVDEVYKISIFLGLSDSQVNNVFFGD